MLEKTIQQKDYKIINPIKKISFYDKTDADNKVNSYSNGRIPMALIGNVSIIEKEMTIELNDMYFQIEDIKPNTKTNIYEIVITLAPTEEILNLYKNGKSFRGTTSKEITLYTSIDCYEIETETNHITINTGLKEYYYGHILEYKKKDIETKKTSNLGYEYKFFVNPNLYKYSEVIAMVKELLNID